MKTSINTQEQVSAIGEAKAFLLISVLIIPLLTVIGIFGYGFIAWALQLIYGPPGHL